MTRFLSLRLAASLALAFAFPVSALAAEPALDYALPAGLQSLGGNADTTPRIRSRGQAAAEVNSRAPSDRLGDTRERVASSYALPEPVQPTEFQDLIRITTGQDLPIFGQEMFAQPPSTFAPLDNVPVTPDYVLGPGDELLIRGWGQVDIDVTATVGRNGAIFIPKVGNLNVGGLRYQDVVPQVKAAVGRIYKNFDLTVSMGQLRAMQVFVVGQAKRPGTYTVSSLSTLVNALLASGGPAPGGSMRAIQLKRSGKVVTTFDLYDLIVDGDKQNDVRLLPGDVVYIPPVGTQVAIYGSINRPAVYEAKVDSSLKDLLGWSGGLSTTAAGQQVSVERIAGRKARQVVTFKLDGSEASAKLEAGDVVNVHAVSPQLQNAVTLRGNVAQTMRFPWREGMRISDIIPDKNALIVPGYWVNRSRAGVAESWLKDEGSETSKGRLGGLNSQVGAAPELSKLRAKPAQLSSQFQSDARAALGDASVTTGQGKFTEELDRGNLEVNWDYAVVERMAPDLSTDLVPFNLGKAVLERDPSQNILLQAGDTVTVFSNRDIVAPSQKQTRFVRLEGEVANPGVYRVQAGESLRQLVSRVGGLTSNAYLFGAELNRESAKQLQQLKLKELADRLEQELQRSASIKANQAITPEAQAALKADLDAQQQLVAKLRQTPVTGRIVLELETDARTWDELPDLPLEDGDRLFVPARPGFVLVQGSVYSQNAYIHRDTKRLGDYVAQAGGATRSADEADTFVIRADGSVVNKRNQGLFGAMRGIEIMPGDTIVVPEDFNKISWMRELKDWSQIIYQFALGAAAFKSLN
ncbi:polysaccharide biosynthesis/export family protein [Chitinimonas taiwanensis]|uniref:Protein involved in polysaccharide export, contains SLBB domain of the beta-grasp fold n=1 Tax=Chitinimonas taiwanensis DSM 18899 TaxID=1121279 RepID=A0A1K2HQ75_9NEIS|nr:SLBB domain-containing protein [Chitinimonas taiwanensis]SFZ78899.1 protein involved in polysaccharide export, contains SLBB domain of the beta-grasp fold [Chitinimonas taiwanensis DSM 18899]